MLHRTTFSSLICRGEEADLSIVNLPSAAIFPVPGIPPRPWEVSSAGGPRHSFSDIKIAFY
jgi:hypothetical protein